MKNPFQDDNGFWKCPFCPDSWPEEFPFIMWEQEPFTLFYNHMGKHEKDIKGDIETFMLAVKAYKPPRKYWRPGDYATSEKYQSE